MVYKSYFEKNRFYIYYGDKYRDFNYNGPTSYSFINKECSYEDKVKVFSLLNFQNMLKDMYRV